MSIEVDNPVEGSKRMPDGDAGVAAAPGDSELRDAVERALARRALAMTRRPSAYRTSFPLEELELTLEDGEELKLIFKDLAWARLEPAARLAKPRFLHDPRREPAVYAEVLAPHGLGPRHYGATIDAARGRHWLFIERVEGRELYQVGELEIWQAVASWLGEMHSILGGDLDGDIRRARLIAYDEAYYRRWIERARKFAAIPGQPGSSAEEIAWIAERYDRVVEGLLELPKTVIHGELYASNVLVTDDEGGARVCPVDWEMTAAGPGLIDLAALTSGAWGREEREAIVSAYRSVAGIVPFSDDQLDLVRLHLAIQWLGWARPEWTPPEGQRHDWLGEALRLAEGLGL
jgi:Ser/Thr protein kinase RdoA (MazF antagonist)